MTFAILIFMGAAVAVAAFLILSSARMTRDEQGELARAREREEAARRDAEKARENRAHWEARIAADTGAQRDTIVEMRDARGIGDGLGGTAFPAPSARFRRVEAPASLIG